MMANAPSLIPTGDMIPRHELWRRDYRRDRYMRSATIEDIGQRSRDIAANMLGVNEQGQLTPGQMSPEKEQWWVLWTHILEELGLRGAEYGSVNLIDTEAMPWISAPDAPRGLRILRGKSLPSTSYLARVGQRAHLIDSFERGRFRIAPAASYSDPSLNPAIQDDELSVTVRRSGDEAVIRPFNPTTGEEGDPLPVLGEISYSRRLEENFFVLCMTGAYDSRHLDDFGGDAVLLIHNVNRFITRLEKSVRRVRPDLQLAGGRVHYYDPYRVRPDDLIPQMSKHFRYAYQKEFRLVWERPGLTLHEEPFFIEMGTSGI
jgi:hypothetical protein